MTFSEYKQLVSEFFPEREDNFNDFGLKFAFYYDPKQYCVYSSNINTKKLEMGFGSDLGIISVEEFREFWKNTRGLSKAYTIQNKIENISNDFCKI